MEILTISGGSGLFGEVRIPGAKNSVLPIMAASVLCRGTVTLTDVPHLSDVEASARILQSVGCKVLLENGRAVITPPEFPGSAVPEPLMRAMRSSLFYLAPLLARTGRADIYTPGGCRLGARPIDMHLSGLEKMGAHITEKDGGAAAGAGESRVTDTIFENRFACAEGFLRLGASVNVCGRTLHVHGMDLLNGADVEAPDLRGGAALVIAALQAQGSTRVMGAEHISRGYEDIAALLAPLGARITRSWGEPCGRGCRNAGTVL